MAKRYVCVHGHFYQPPRENPWLEAVETQDSAHPDHDWNERITRECYAMNARARVQNAAGRIVSLSNNYARISFNFGPTLLAWMEERAPKTYAEIVAADVASRGRFSGHGSALAQAYNHSILPLCNDRDIATQVAWGLADFRWRFGREAEGMWLPEAAADTRSLEALAARGVVFTVLAPRQCAMVRDTSGRERGGAWHEPHGGVDPTRAYRCPLPSGKSITVLFYDGPISQAVAFEGLLNDGARFASRLREGFNGQRTHDQLVHIATDGETYGHHHRHGEMALAAALNILGSDASIALTNYGEFVAKHPATWECRVVENSSWSCVHGVERWRADCGCNTGRAGWHQRWREPLRGALDWLRDAVNARYEAEAGDVMADPWGARDAYIDVILDRAPSRVNEFLSAHAPKARDAAGRVRAMRLMELQRHAMLMYTSCAWFFDDVAGIEASQVLQYAGRVLQLGKACFGVDLEEEFVARLSKATGNDPALPDGRAVYGARVAPAMLDHFGVGAHYALSRVLDGRAERVYTYDAVGAVSRRRSAGRARLLSGHATLRSRVTLEEAHLSYAVLHQGDHSASCAVRRFTSEGAFDASAKAIEAAFDRADYAEVLRVLEREFAEPGEVGEGGRALRTIEDLFRDEQYAVTRKILEPALAQIDATYAQIYEQHAPLARFLRSLKLSVPRRIAYVGTFVLSHGIRHALKQSPMDVSRAMELADEAAREGITLDRTVLVQAAHRAMGMLAGMAMRGEEARAGAAGHTDYDSWHGADDAVVDALGGLAHPVHAGVDLAADPFADERTIGVMVELGRFVSGLPFGIDIWPLQEACVERVRPLAATMRELAGGAGAAGGAEYAARWCARLGELGAILRVEVEAG